MGDIKAKDLNVAGSVAASDMILGSSINGTTANVTVETVGNYIVDQLSLASLSNSSVKDYVLSLNTQIRAVRDIRTPTKEYNHQTANQWEYTGHSYTPPTNHIVLIQGGLNYTNSKPIACALSASPNQLIVRSESQSLTDNGYVQNCPMILVTDTVYLWEKRNASGSNVCYFRYIDLGLIT